ncbi:hypothetical protein J4216_00580 [Candidatus Woesearchaeota archaeon]|nr:hypothetical protein [Candidatus Woesearchaeota archaeon]
MQAKKIEYDRLEFKKDQEIPYLKGTRIRADAIYVHDYITENRTPEHIAKDRDLSIQDITQAIEWGTANEGIIKKVLEREYKNRPIYKK